jgi:hypothetical protein
MGIPLFLPALKKKSHAPSSLNLSASLHCQLPIIIITFTTIITASASTVAIDI